jgi:dCTP deaminase
LNEGQYFEILPGEFVVVGTLEKVKLSKDIMAILYPRSSINRKGLSIDLSGIIDAGYEGSLIIPVRNNTDNQVIRIYPGERFCQIVFHTLNKAVDIRKSRYDKKHISVGVLDEETDIEPKLILQGKIKELKRKYCIDIDKT